MSTFGTADITLTATNQAIYTANGGAPVTIGKAIVCNVDSASRTVTVYKVPSGGTAGNGNIVIDGSGTGAFSVGAGQTRVLPISGLVLNQGDSFQGFASVTSVVNVSLSYVSP